jgi:hypothetical protein
MAYVSVDFVYLDPPFNLNASYNVLSHAAVCERRQRRSVQPPLGGPCKMLVQHGNGRLI